MTLLPAGYWPTTYWAEDYWIQNYWPEYGTAIVLTGDAQPSDVRFGKTFYNTDPTLKLTGTWVPTVGTGGGVIYREKPSELTEPSLMLNAVLLMQKLKKKESEKKS